MLGVRKSQKSGVADLGSRSEAAELGWRVERRNALGDDVISLSFHSTEISARRAQPFSACARAENALSRSKRPRFTEEEDTKLVDLKERRGWSWEDIQRSFPGRSTGSLQVRYFTKLKDRNTAS